MVVRLGLLYLGAYVFGWILTTSSRRHFSVRRACARCYAVYLRYLRYVLQSCTSRVWLCWSSLLHLLQIWYLALHMYVCIYVYIYNIYIYIVKQDMQVNMNITPPHPNPIVSAQCNCVCKWFCSVSQVTCPGVISDVAPQNCAIFSDTTNIPSGKLT